jgi:hypothetical protein
MAVYTVHEPPLRAGATAVPEPERFVFVRDGFAFWALLLGPLWMLRHRMWLVLLLYMGLAVGLSLVLHLQTSARIGFIVWGLIALLLGFEASTLRRFTLGRRRYRNIGIVVSDDLELAERRFFDAWVRKDQVRKDRGGKDRPEPAGAGGAPALTPLRMPHPASDVLGLFPEPGSAP